MIKSLQPVVFAAFVATCLALPAPGGAIELFGLKIFEQAKEQKIDVLDPQTYRLELTVSGSEALRDQIRNSSALWQDRGQPAAGSAGLIAKAKNDYAAVLAALYRAGYYGGRIDILIAGQEVTGLSLVADFPADVAVSIAVEPGERFRFGALELVNPATAIAATGFLTGEPARSTVIANVVEATIANWRERGFAKASLGERDVVADHARGELDVTLAFLPGPRTYFGLVTAAGSRRVDEDFIRYMADISPGTVFDPKVLDDAQARLARLGVFGSVRIIEAEVLVGGDQLPVTIAVQDRPARRFGFGATYSSIDGLAVEGFWLHRNLFGRAEQLRFDASIAGIDGAFSAERYDYVLALTYVVPGFIGPDTDFSLSGEVHHLIMDGFEDDSFSVAAGVTHIFSDRLSGSAFVELERSRFTSAIAVDDITLASVTGTLTFDNRDDRLDAHAGIYLNAAVSPFQDLETGNAGVSAIAEVRAYRALDEDAKFVLAGRLKFGSLIGSGLEDTPPDRLFFAGGGGSIRGYGYQSVGAGTLAGDPLGGLSLVETSLELRARLSRTLGIVGFVDAGLVGPDRFPNGDERFLAGAGLGLRYFTGLGPLRLDLALPFDRQGSSADFAVYIGIGQAF